MSRAEERKLRLKRAVVGAIGRSIDCELCGEPLVKAIPVIWRGEVKLIGAEEALVAVDFASMNRLVFRHVEAADCPAQRR